MDIVQKECKLKAEYELVLRPEINSDSRRMDVVVDSFPAFGRKLWVDFGVTCPVPEVFHADSHLARTVTAGVACTGYAKAKLSTYNDLLSPNVRFTPAIVDIFGYWHEPFIQLIRELATVAVTAASASQPFGYIIEHASSRLVHRWLLRFSIILQREQSKQVLRLAGAGDSLASPFRPTHIDTLLSTTRATREIH